MKLNFERIGQYSSKETFGHLTDDQLIELIGHRAKFNEYVAEDLIPQVGLERKLARLNIYEASLGVPLTRLRNDDPHLQITKPEIETHTDSVEFELAEEIWRNASNRDAQMRALDIYRLACKKNDARAFLALYKINAEWKYSYLLTGKQHYGGEYIGTAIKLGHLPAFLYMGCLYELSTFVRLIYLSTGIALAKRNDDKILLQLEDEFLGLSARYAKELLPEIIQRGQEWKPGTLVNLSESELQGVLLEHPNKYNEAENQFFLATPLSPEITNIEDYLRNLPGHQDYERANSALDEGDSELAEHHLEIAAKQGNGQALYAQLIGPKFRRHLGPEELIRCAQHGSPDSFDDLFEEIDHEYECKSPVFSIFTPSKDPEFNALIDCVLYLYTIMERLGIERYASFGLIVDCLSTETESGYERTRANLSELKYRLCDHAYVCEVNSRAQKWSLGERFDPKFLKNLSILFPDAFSSNNLIY